MEHVTNSNVGLKTTVASADAEGLFTEDCLEKHSKQFLENKKLLCCYVFVDVQAFSRYDGCSHL